MERENGEWQKRAGEESEKQREDEAYTWKIEWYIKAEGGRHERNRKGEGERSTEKAWLTYTRDVYEVERGVRRRL